MHKKNAPAAVAAALVCLLLTGCTAPAQSGAESLSASTPASETVGTEETAQAAVTFTDALGYTVTVQSWQRVVGLYGSYAEAWTLAGGTLIGATQDAIEERGLALAEDAAVVGSIQEPNLEEILALSPDFVILSADTSEQAALHDALTQAGVPHAYFRTNSFDEYLSMLRIFCDMTGREDLYKQNGTDVGAQIDDIVQTVRTAGEPQPTVLLLRAYSSGCKAKGSDNLAGVMLKELGAANIADSDTSLLEDLSMEQIIADDPDFIFVVTMGASQQKALDWVAQNLQSSPAWAGLSAVQNGRYTVLPKELFHYKPNARWAESYRTLAALLYPDLNLEESAS